MSMISRLDDTIAAIASAAGGAARGIVRISGPDVVACLDRCFTPTDADAFSQAATSQASVVEGDLRLSSSDARLPCLLYLWPTSRSYTRAPSAELHTLGSPPLLEAALAVLCDAGARVAEPGEFTLRAFLAGRIDLTQAEAVLGVIDAVDRRSLDVALGQLAGGLSDPLNALRDELIDLLAHLEAGLDFVEEDIEFVTTTQLSKQLEAALERIEGLNDQMRTRGKATGSVEVVLLGWPNVGKSSLFNALVGSSAAITSETAGTTRDYLRARVEFDGLTCELIDTAGINAQAPTAQCASPEAGVVDPVDLLAQQLGSERQQRAQVQLFCLDGTRASNEGERAELARPTDAKRLKVLTKADRPIHCEIAADVVQTSSVTGQGLDELRRSIRQAALDSPKTDADVVAGTASRCRESLRLCAESLRRALAIAEESPAEELIAAEIRVSLDELGKVVGAVYTDDVLDRIFSTFCIGK